MTPTTLNTPLENIKREQGTLCINLIIIGGQSTATLGCNDSGTWMFGGDIIVGESKSSNEGTQEMFQQLFVAISVATPSPRIILQMLCVLESPTGVEDNGRCSSNSFNDLTI